MAGSGDFYLKLSLLSFVSHRRERAVEKQKKNGMGWPAFAVHRQATPLRWVCAPGKESQRRCGAPYRPDPGCWGLRRLGTTALGQEPTQEQIQVQEALLAQVLDALTQRSQPRPPYREKRCVYDKYIYLSMLDSQLKMRP